MPDLSISSITAREVLDCRGLPTVQVDVVAGGVLGRADVPSGRSTGSHEAHELRDGGARFGGFGVRTAVANVNDRVAPHLIGHDVAHQRALDAALIELDGTEDKSALGANAILGVSLAAVRAAAAAHELPLYRYLNANAHVLPVPQVNLINGGRHASNDLDFQEFIMIPSGAESVLQALQIATEVNLQLGEILLDKFGKAALNTGDEGGYAPPLSDPEQALGYLHEAVGRAGYDDLVTYGLDCAATHYYDAATETYLLAGQRHDRAGMIELYQRLIARFGIVTIEDPLHEDDFEGFAELTEAGAANSLLWKVNQIGTLSEALDAADQAYRHGYTVVVSERSGETEDAIIADLSVALNAGQIKTGAPVRGERTAKYNALLLIAEELGTAGVYPTQTGSPTVPVG